MNILFVIVLTPALWYFAWGRDAGVLGAALAACVLIVHALPKSKGVLAVGQLLLLVIGASYVLAVGESLLKLGARLL